MSKKVIDERVVEMRFDNKQFEKATTETLGTLARLKEALKLPSISDAFKGMDKATQKASAIDRIAESVESLEKRFSMLGIVGMRVIQNLTDGFMNQLTKAVHFATDAIIQGGIRRAMNIENAHFQLQALLKDEAKVQEVMDDAMASVDGTAYAFDEAAKAASQFSASGIQAGEDMLGALKGITGVAAMTNSQFEDISMIFTTVAGNGRLMGDQLLQLSSRGLNAASTLANYFKEVRGEAGMTEETIRDMVSKGQVDFKTFADAMYWAFGESAERANETFTGSLANMKSALARIGAGFISPLVEQNSEMVNLFNALRIQINNVKSALVFDEQKSAISGLAKVTGITKDELGEMFTLIKEQGHASAKEFETLNKKGATSYVDLMKYMNGVTDGSIHASYAVTSLVKELSNGAKVTHGQVKEFVREGKIDLNTFTSAMEHAYGDQKALSKQFTDFVLDNIQGLVAAINSVDLTKPLETFYYFIESIKNLAKGLFSIVKPIIGAFDEVFLSFSMDSVVNIAAKIELLTSKFKLSERQASNLRKTFKGVFDVVKLLIDVFIALVRVIIPVNEPMVAMGDGLLGITAGIGETLSEFTKFLRACPAIRKGYETISTAVQNVMTFLAEVIYGMGDFIDKVNALPAVQRILEMINDTFQDLGEIFEPLFNDIGIEFENLWKRIEESIPTDAEAFLDSLLGDIERFANSIDQDKLLNFLQKFTSSIRDFMDMIRSNEGLDIFIQHMMEFFEGVQEAFTIDTLIGKIDYVMAHMKKFIDWVRTTFAPAFESFSIGGVLATAGGGGIVYTLFEIMKTINKWGEAIKPIPDAFTAVKDALKAWQKDLEADRLLKISGAIFVLAAALTMLSFADTERLLIAAGVLVTVGGILAFGIGTLINALNKGKPLPKLLAEFSNSLSKGFTRLTKGLKWKLIGSMFKDIAKAIGIVAVTIIGLGLMWQNNADAIKAGGLLALGISAALLVIVAAISGISNIVGAGAANVKKVASSALIVCIAVGVLVGALNDLMAIQLPSNSGEIWAKVGLFAAAVLGVGALVLAVGAASKLAGGGSIKTAPILGAALSIVVVVKALEAVLKLDIGQDDIGKIAVFAGLFLGMGYLIRTIGKASKDAGGALKGVAVLIALSFTIGILVGALMIMTLVPWEKLVGAAVALGIVLVALGQTLKGAGSVTSETNYKSVVAMAVIVGALTAALGLLSMIPWDKLIPAVAALDLTLLSLAAVFNGMGKVKTDMFGTTLAMIAMVGVIALSLSALSNQPWEGLLAAAGSMSLCISAFSLVFLAIGKAGPSVDTQGVALFLMATTAILPIAAALYLLSSQPWEGMLAAGAALSATVAAYGYAFNLIGNTNVDLSGVGLFIFGTAAVIGIALALRILSDQPWDSLLASATAISGVLLALATAMSITSAVGQGPASAAIKGIGLLDLFVANLVAVLAILGGLWQFEWFQNLINGGLEMLVTVGYGLGNFVGSIVGGVIGGVSKGLVELGENLSKFMESAGPFFEGCGKLDSEVANSVKNLAEMMLILTANELISGITEWLSGSAGEDPLVKFGEQLVEFGPKIAEFAEIVKDVNPSAVQGAAAAAEIMAELAEKLPKTGGFYQQVFGENKTLAQFGEELRKFGPKIAEFAEAVKDVSSEAVQGAADAATIMADLGDRLPRTGGLYQKIFGDKKTLSQFGIELSLFGPALLLYCEATKDITSAAVTGSAAAVSILQDMADNMPDTKSLWEKIFGGGSMSLTEFAEDLLPFGQGMKAFSDEVKDINASTLDGVIQSLNKLIDLALRVEEVDAFALPSFADGLSTIGSECVDNFITAFSNSEIRVIVAVTKLLTAVHDTFEAGRENLVEKGVYAASGICEGISRGITQNRGIISQSITELGNYILQNMSNAIASDKAFFLLGQTLVLDLATGIKNQESNAKKTVSTLSTSMITTIKAIITKDVMIKIGTDQITWITTGINTQKSLLMSTVTDYSNQTISIIRNIWTNQTFNRIGSDIMVWITSGIEGKRYSLISTVQSIANQIVSTTRNGLPFSTFSNVGQTTMNGLSSGINYGGPRSVYAAQNVAVSVRNAVQSSLSYQTFHGIGENIANGLSNGIISRVNEIVNAAREAAQAVINATKAAFEVRSPSRLYERIGGFLNEGLAIGIRKTLNHPVKEMNVVSDQIIKKAKTTVDEINDKVSGLTPKENIIKITPIMDMSELKKDTDEISKMFNDAISNQRVDAESTSKKFIKDHIIRSEEATAEKESLEALKTANKYIMDHIPEMGTTIDNKFYIQGDDPEAIAEKVSDVLGKQLERRKNVWG